MPDHRHAIPRYQQHRYLADLFEVRSATPLGIISPVLKTLTAMVPNPGDSANFRGLKLTAQTTDERRVREVLVELAK